MSEQVEPVNLGNPAEYSINELAECVSRVIGKQIEYEFKELPKDDPKVRQPDIRLAREILGWEPGIPLEDGLVQTLDYFRGLTNQ